jgi:hypothetical protein
MRGRARAAAVVAVVLALGVGVGAPRARAETLLDALRATGLRPPAEPAAQLARPLVQRVSMDLEAGLVVVGRTDAGELLAARFDRRSGRWLVKALVAPPAPAAGAGEGPGLAECGTLQEMWSWGGAGGVRVTTHLNPSAGCTILVDPALGVAAVLYGWPLAELGDRLLYHRSQVHFAGVHPLEIALFDPRTGASRTIHPMRPFQAVRQAHVARARAAYTAAQCAERNHACDPERFDEQLVGDVAINPRADAVAFVTELDNAAFWPEADRIRLEAFRELRAALARPAGAAGDDTAYRAVAEGLARMRNLGLAERVADTLAADAVSRQLVAQALAQPARPGESPREWLLRLDPRWGGPATWRRLAGAIAVADEAVQVVHVYRGLADPATTEFREVPLAEFRARFGPGALDRVLDPAALGRLFAPPPGAPRR